MTIIFTPTDNLKLPTAWHRLKTIWQGREEEIQKGLPYTQLVPAWQLLLLGDGSPTRHLQLLTCEYIEVDVTDMYLIGRNLDNAMELIEAISSPKLRI